MCGCIHKLLIDRALVMLELADFEEEAIVAHDDTCGRHIDVCCDCRPRIVLETYGQDIRITEDGRVMTELWH